MKVDSRAPSRAPGADAAPAARRPVLTTASVGIAAVIAAAVALRFVTRSDLWLDEALSVNVAKLPLGQLHEALRHDGAPPLYYVLLHGWIQVFGSGDVAVRALSGVFAVGTLPLAWLAGKRLGGRTVAWAAVLVFASSPYAVRYATEARMYSIEIFLVLAGYLLLWRVLEQPNLPRMAPLAVVVGLLLYTQYWSVYLLVVVGLGLVVRAWRRTGMERRAAQSAIVALAAGVITFVPWVPTFLYQLDHTGTPWGAAVSPPTAIGDAFVDFAGGEHSETVVLILPLLLLALLAVFGSAGDRNHVELDLRTRPGVRWEAVVAIATLVVGASWSFASGSAFQGRYAAIMFPLFLLAVAFGVTVFSAPRVRAGVLAFVVLLGFVGGARNVLEHRTQAYQVAGKIKAAAKRGDLVVYCPDQVAPAVSRLLPDRLRLEQIAFPTGKGPEIVDWVDYKRRNEAADVTAFAQDALRRAGDHDVWFVWAPGYRTFAGKCEELANSLRVSRPGAVTLVEPDSVLFEFQGLIRYPKP